MHVKMPAPQWGIFRVETGIMPYDLLEEPKGSLLHLALDWVPTLITDSVTQFRR